MDEELVMREGVAEIMENKIWTAEKWLNLGAILPLVVVVVISIFFSNSAVAPYLLTISLVVLGICLVVGTQILPALRLWKFIAPAPALILNTVAFMIIYILSYVYFFYQFVIVKTESSIPMLILMAAIVYQRMQSTDKTVQKYITEHLDHYPEEAKKREEQRQKELEEAKRQAEELARIEAEEAKNKESIPSFDEFFEIDQK